MLRLIETKCYKRPKFAVSITKILHGQVNYSNGDRSRARKSTGKLKAVVKRGIRGGTADRGRLLHAKPFHRRKWHNSGPDVEIRGKAKEKQVRRQQPVDMCSAFNTCDSILRSCRAIIEVQGLTMVMRLRMSHQLRITKCSAFRLIRWRNWCMTYDQWHDDHEI